MVVGRGRDLSSLQKKIIMDVEQMNDDELRALFAFIESLRKINNKEFHTRSINARHSRVDH